MAAASGEEASDALLARLGAELARAVPPALESWVVMRGGQVMAAWGATRAGSTGLELEGLHEQLVVAARRAAEQASAALSELAAADVDDQRVTPLQISRAATAGPTHVMRQAGVPAVVRDRFAEERFPEDVYCLHPPSLAALAEDLGPLSLAWGAAKAAVHLARHAGAPEV